MVTIHLEVLQAHSSPQGYKTARYPGWDLSVGAQDVCLQEEEERKADLKAEASETLIPDQQRRESRDCSTGLQNRPWGSFSPLQPHSLRQWVTVSCGFEPHSTCTSNFSFLAEELWQGCKKAVMPRQQKPHAGDVARLPTFTDKKVHTLS